MNTESAISIEEKAKALFDTLNQHLPGTVRIGYISRYKFPANAYSVERWESLPPMFADAFRKTAEDLLP